MKQKSMTKIAANPKSIDTDISCEIVLVIDLGITLAQLDFDCIKKMALKLMKAVEATNIPERNIISLPIYKYYTTKKGALTFMPEC